MTVMLEERRYPSRRLRFLAVLRRLPGYRKQSMLRSTGMMA